MNLKREKMFSLKKFTGALLCIALLQACGDRKDVAENTKKSDEPAVVIAAVDPLKVHEASTLANPKLQKRAAQSLGAEPAAVAISDVEAESKIRTNFKAYLNDGVYSCYLTHAGQVMSDAMCVSMNGKGVKPANNALLDAAAKQTP